MAKTSAERQAAYRARRNDGEGDRRINTWISTKADLALERLAHRYGVTKREMIERLVNSADNEILQTLQFDTPEWDVYLNVTQ
jgi:putative heme iron utilization protein